MLANSKCTATLTFSPTFSLCENKRAMPRSCAAISDELQPTLAERFIGEGDTLFAEHFCDHENHDGAQEATAKYHIKNRISDGRHGGKFYNCVHKSEG